MPVRAILIDPFACTITEVEHDASDFRNIYPLLSHESMKVGHFEIVHLDHGDAIYVDGEGLNKPCERFFIWSGYHEPLAGKGLILGSNDNGDTVSAKITLAKVRKHVVFTEHVLGAGLVRNATPWRNLKP